MVMAYTAADEAENKDELETAVAGFEALGDYSDAPARLVSVQEKIRARDYAAAVTALNDEDYSKAVTMFGALGDYQDSAGLLLQAQTGVKYQTAVTDALAGRLSQAYNEFAALGDYKDSAKKAEICGNLSRASKTQQIAEGVLIYDFHDLWGIANLNTNVITAAKYTSIKYENETQYQSRNLLKVYIKGTDKFHDTYGYMDMNGKEVISCTYLGISDFNQDGLCTVAKADKYGSTYYYGALGIADYTGKILSTPQWKEMGESKSQKESRVGRWSSYDLKITAPIFVDGRMKVQNTDDQWGFINEKGQVLGSVKWYSIGDFSDGMAMVCETSKIKSGYYSYSTKTAYKYGFINEQGQTIGEVRWDAVNAFSNGLAAVQENGYWGFINKNNELVIPCQYTEVSSFKADGTCDVKTKSGTWQVINTSGEVTFF